MLLPAPTPNTSRNAKVYPGNAPPKDILAHWQTKDTGRYMIQKTECGRCLLVVFEHSRYLVRLGSKSNSTQATGPQQ
jgi:hypothetical protein